LLLGCSGALLITCHRFGRFSLYKAVLDCIRAFSQIVLVLESSSLKSYCVLGLFHGFRPYFWVLFRVLLITHRSFGCFLAYKAVSDSFPQFLQKLFDAP